MKVFLGALLATVMTSAVASENLNQALINSTIEVLESATKACDYKVATQFYFKESLFFSYEQGELVSEESWPDLADGIKKTMDSCKIKYVSETTLNENLEFSSDMKEATHSDEAIYVLQTNDGRKFKTHQSGRLRFGVEDGKVVILETHVNTLSFEFVE